DLANQIQAKMMTIPNSANGGVHTANFRVLRLASCPAVLVECGYLSNRSEGNKTRDWEYRELLADRIAEAIVEQRFGSGVYRSSTQVAAQPQPQVEPPSGGTGLAPATEHRQGVEAAVARSNSVLICACGHAPLHAVRLGVRTRARQWLVRDRGQRARLGTD